MKNATVSASVECGIPFSMTLPAKSILRSLFCALLCLLLPTAAAERYIVDYDGPGEGYDHYALLLTEDGDLLSDATAYEKIQCITPEGWPENQRLYAATRHGVPEDMEPWEGEYVNDVLLMDADGQPVTGFDYTMLAYDPAADRVIAWYTNEVSHAKLLSRDGEVLANWRDYWDVVPNGAGGYIVGGEDGALAYIAPDLSVRSLELTGSIDDWLDSHTYHDGYLPVGFINDSSENGFIDVEGRLAFGRTFARISLRGWGLEGFHGGRAAVRLEENDDWQFIDTSRNLMPMTYNHIQWYDMLNGWLCRTPKGIDFYHADEGMRLSQIPVSIQGDWDWDSVCRGLLCVGIKNGQCDLFDTEGNLLVRGQNGEIGNVFSCTYCDRCDARPEVIVYGNTEGQCHLIDLEGRRITDDYRFIHLALWQDGHGLYVTERITEDVPEDVLKAQGWSHGDVRYGLIDETGRTLLEMDYNDLYVVSPDRLWICQGDRHALIDLDGNTLFETSDYAFLMD